MGEDLGRLLNVVLAVVSVGALGGVGYVRGRIGDLRDQLKDARDEIADLDRRLTKVTAERDQTANDLDALSRVVTGEAHWVAIGQKAEELGDKLDVHHTEAEVHWGKDEQLLQGILDAIKRLPTAPRSEGS